MTPHHSSCTGLPERRGHGANTYPEHLARTWTLASGEVVLLRPVRHDDGEREEGFVRGLSLESGYQRMLSAFKITPEWIERMTHIDYRCHMAFAVTAAKDGVEQFVGVGRYVAAPNGADRRVRAGHRRCPTRPGAGSTTAGSIARACARSRCARTRRHCSRHQPGHVVTCPLARFQGDRRAGRRHGGAHPTKSATSATAVH